MNSEKLDHRVNVRLSPDAMAVIDAAVSDMNLAGIKDTTGKPYTRAAMLRDVITVQRRALMTDKKPVDRTWATVTISLTEDAAYWLEANRGPCNKSEFVRRLVAREFAA